MANARTTWDEIYTSATYANTAQDVHMGQNQVALRDGYVSGGANGSTYNASNDTPSTRVVRRVYAIRNGRKVLLNEVEEKGEQGTDVYETLNVATAAGPSYPTKSVGFNAARSNTQLVTGVDLNVYTDPEEGDCPSSFKVVKVVTRISPLNIRVAPGAIVANEGLNPYQDPSAGSSYNIWGSLVSDYDVAGPTFTLPSFGGSNTVVIGGMGSASDANNGYSPPVVPMDLPHFTDEDDVLINNAITNGSGSPVSFPHGFINGNNTLEGLLGRDVIHGGDGNDIIYGNSSTNTVGDGSNSLFGDCGSDSIIAGDGGDLIFGDCSITVTGGDGHIHEHPSDDTHEHNDTIIAGQGNDTIVAGIGNDSVQVSGGTDIVDLGEGNDTARIQGVTDAWISTGSGNDSISLDSTTSGAITIELTDGEDSVNIASGASGTVSIQSGIVQNFPAIQGAPRPTGVNDTVGDAITISSGANVTVGATLGSGNDSLQIGGGTITIDLGDGGDLASITGGIVSMNAGLGNDSLQIDGGTATIDLGDGGDLASITGGTVSMNAGLGNDSLQIDGGTATIDLGAGSDTVNIAQGTVSITESGAVSSDTNIIGVAGGNVSITLGDAADSINITNGTVGTLVTGAGNDTISISGGVVGTTTSTLSTGTGDDSVVIAGGTVQGQLDLGEGNDYIALNGGIIDSVSLDLGAGSDTVDITQGTVSITESGAVSSDTNVIGVAGGNVSITLGDAADSINITNGTVGTLVTGAGNDTISISGGILGTTTSTLSTGTGNDSVVVAGGTVQGQLDLGEGNDYIALNGGTIDSVSLGAGNDTLVLGAGKYAGFDMGTGSDSVHVTNAVTGSITINLTGDTLGDALLVDTTTQPLTINATFSNGNDSITINGGNASISGGAGSDIVSVGSGVSGDVTLNFVDGTEGDSIAISDGMTTKAHVTLGAGNDTVYVGKGTAGHEVFLGEGRDSVTVNGGGTLHVGAGADSIVINGGTNSLYVENIGNGQTTTITSGSGNTAGDYLSVESTAQGALNVSLGQGSDTISIAGGSGHIINAGDGANAITVSGGSGSAFSAGSGNDTVRITAGSNDTINVGGGNNSVNISAGNNHNVTAGSGNDTIVISSGSGHSVSTGAGSDRLIVSNGVGFSSANLGTGTGDASDILELTGGANTVDYSGKFSNISGVDILSVSSGAVRVSADNIVSMAKNSHGNSYCIIKGQSSPVPQLVIDVKDGGKLVLDGDPGMILALNGTVRIVGEDGVEKEFRAYSYGTNSNPAMILVPLEDLDKVAIVGYGKPPSTQETLLSSVNPHPIAGTIVPHGAGRSMSVGDVVDGVSPLASSEVADVVERDTTESNRFDSAQETGKHNGSEHVTIGESEKMVASSATPGAEEKNDVHTASTDTHDTIPVVHVEGNKTTLLGEALEKASPENIENSPSLHEKEGIEDSKDVDSTHSAQDTHDTAEEVVNAPAQEKDTSVPVDNKSDEHSIDDVLVSAGESQQENMIQSNGNTSTGVSEKEEGVVLDPSKTEEVVQSGSGDTSVVDLRGLLPEKPTELFVVNDVPNDSAVYTSYEVQDTTLQDAELQATQTIYHLQ